MYERRFVSNEAPKTSQQSQPLAIPTRPQPFLVMENVSKVYPTPKGPFVVLDDVNLTVNQGSLFV